MHRSDTVRLSTTSIDSPIGTLTLKATDGILSGLLMRDQRHAVKPSHAWEKNESDFTAVIDQLDAYFAGTLVRFDLPLALSGTDFQLKVWRALREIPYGQTVSYGEIANGISSPGSCRAVGLANGRNPIGIIVPCHRVIGADGSLTGYGGGLERKLWLLEHETATARRLGLPSSHEQAPQLELEIA